MAKTLLIINISFLVIILNINRVIKCERNFGMQHRYLIQNALWFSRNESFFNRSAMYLISSKCQSGIENLLEGLKGNKVWAVKMIDANAKLPSGILRGNINQYGDFDECLSVNEAKYCLAEIDISNLWNNRSIELRNLVHSYFAFRGNVSDPAHRVPDFSLIKWGLCIPKECTTVDTEIFLKSNFNLRTNVKNSMCRNAVEETALTLGDYLARAIFMALFLTIFLGTFVEYFSEVYKNNNGIIWKVLSCFAIQKNWRQLIELDNKKIRGVDGIRALSALGLIMSHKSVAMLYNPYINRTSAAEGLGRAWSVIGRTAIIYTDSFMLISGLLNSKPLFEELEKGNTLDFKKRIIGRIFRITPNLLVVILFSTYILPNLGSGPLWPLVIGHHSTLCKKYMWRNLLFIHNYFGFENMCLTHTHQLGIDFQLYLVTPVLIYLISKNASKGLKTVVGIIFVSTILRLWATIHYELSHVVYFGVTIKKMFDTANFSYILPTHRASIYLMGILLAFFMFKTKRRFQFSKFQLISFWILALSLGLLAMLGPYHMARIGYQYNVVDAAIYGSLSPIAWGVCCVWGVIVSDLGYGGWLGDFLSWKGFQWFSKISYSVYLIQFPVFFYFVGIQRSSEEYKPYQMLHLSETLIIILLSTLLTLTVELPFQQIGQLFLKDNKKTGVAKDNDVARKVKSG